MTRECMRPSFEGSVNMDLLEEVDEDDYVRKQVSCSNTTHLAAFSVLRISAIKSI